MPVICTVGRGTCNINIVCLQEPPPPLKEGGKANHQHTFGPSPMVTRMLRNWSAIVVAARLSLSLALPNSPRTWQMFALKTELRPVSGNHQVVYRHPECFYFCPLVWWENGWVWWNMSSLPLRLMQPAGRTLETSVWNSYRPTLSLWPFYTSLSITPLWTHVQPEYTCTTPAFAVAAAYLHANIFGADMLL